MLGLSLTTTYAIKALACLEQPECACRQIRDIAACTGVPKPYLAKIINAMARRGLVNAKRGHKGGICLASPPERIALLQIIEAVEGPNWISPCLLAGEKCPPGFRCPTKPFWERFKRDVRKLLARTTLAQMIAARQAMLRSAARPMKASLPATSRRRPGRPPLRALI